MVQREEAQNSILKAERWWEWSFANVFMRVLAAEECSRLPYSSLYAIVKIVWSEKFLRIFPSSWRFLRNVYSFNRWDHSLINSFATSVHILYKKMVYNEVRTRLLKKLRKFSPGFLRPSKVYQFICILNSNYLSINNVMCDILELVHTMSHRYDPNLL